MAPKGSSRHFSLFYEEKVWLHIYKHSLCVAKEVATMVHITDPYVNQGYGSIFQRQTLALK